MGYIYKITNNINGKAYIGQSINDPIKSRIHTHLNGHQPGCRAIHNAVKKYGKDNFTYEILYAVLLDDLLDDLEVQAIKEHNTLSPNGYNLTSGGGAPKQVSDETRQKISEANKGHTHSESARRKMSESHKGKTHSESARRKMSELQRRPEYHPAREYFLSLPLDMDITDKRKLVFSKYNKIPKFTIYRWIREWISD